MMRNTMVKGRPRSAAGVSLVETMVAVGVLAVVVPLSLAAMLKAGEVGRSARAETRAPAIAEQCRAEVEAAMRGRSAHFPQLAAGEPFPPEGQVMALAVGRDGAVLGSLPRAAYDRGIERLEGKDVSYLAVVSGVRSDSEWAGEPAVVLTVSVEHPAALKRLQRSKLGFHTRLP